MHREANYNVRRNNPFIQALFGYAPEAPIQDLTKGVEDKEDDLEKDKEGEDKDKDALTDPKAIVKKVDPSKTVEVPAEEFKVK